MDYMLRGNHCGHNILYLFDLVTEEVLQESTWTEKDAVVEIDDDVITINTADDAITCRIFRR